MAALAGLASFLSPCVLPLVPGYLSYVTGLAGSDLAATGTGAQPAGRGRTITGAGLFVAGFTAVFLGTAVTAAELGRMMLVHARAIEIGAGLLTVALGVVFLGMIPSPSPSPSPCHACPWLPCGSMVFRGSSTASLCPVQGSP